MLNKPKFMRPSTNMQECFIDTSSDDLSFSCIVDGNEAVYAWRIQIYRLDDNVLVYDTGKITKLESDVYSPLFYPVNEKNQNEIFKINLTDYPSDDVPTKDSDGKVISPVPEFTNSPEPYYWTIEFWNKSDIEKDNATTKSCEEVFYANTTPEATLYYKKNGDSGYTEFPDDTDKIAVFEANEYTFKADYIQEENVPLKRYGWRLTDTDTGQVLLDTITQNQVYGTGDNIICTYDGLLNSGNYSIELYVETQNNVTLNTIPTPFSVSYETTYLSSDFVTEVLEYEPAVRNSWADAKVIEGVRSYEKDDYIYEYPIVGGGTTAVKIPNGETITYDYGSTSNLDITEDCYIVLSMQLLSGKDTKIFEAEGKDPYGNDVMRRLEFKNGQFVYTVGNSSDGYKEVRHTPSDGYKPNKYVWYIITMSPYLWEDTELTVTESRAINGLYPKADLYPSANLYPTFGEWDKLKKESDV